MNFSIPAIITSSPEQTLELGRALGLAARPGDVILLTGELGSGKTQFTKGIARALGVDRPITSPTFNLIYEYQDATGSQIVLRHFDLYRLEREEELDDIDYFGLLEDAVVSVVEWGDKFPGALPNDYLLVEFAYIDEFTRLLRYQAAGRSSALLLERLRGLPGGVQGGTPGGMPDGMPVATPGRVLDGLSGGVPDGR